MTRGENRWFADPVHGLEMRFDDEDAGPDELVILTRIQPGGELAEHFHIGIEERWQVLEGEVEIKHGGVWNRLTVGDGLFTVGSGERHALRNPADKPGRLRTVATPPGGLREFIVESAWAARAGLFNRRGLPTGLRGLAWAVDFAWRFRQETVVCHPPPALQRALVPAARRATRRFRPSLAVRNRE